MAPGEEEGGESPPQVEALRRSNERLERELRESREREAAVRRELEWTRAKLRVAEEAEERLCSQLGELEAESVDQSRAFCVQIQALVEQLARSQRALLLLQA